MMSTENYKKFIKASQFYFKLDKKQEHRLLSVTMGAQMTV